MKQNSSILDTIVIEPIQNQPVQISIRKLYAINVKDVFTINDINSGKLLKKDFFSEKQKSFVVLGLGKNQQELYLDTCSYDYVPPYL